MAHAGVIAGTTATTAAAVSATGDQELQAIREQMGGSDGDNSNAGESDASKLRTVHGAGLQVPLPANVSSARVAIVKTCWHAELIGAMRDKCAQRLQERGVLAENIVDVDVPGSFELPFAAASVLQRTGDRAVDAVVCIGILLKGGTIHMEVIANTVTPAIMELQLKHGKPVIFGVLTVLAIEQAKERAHSDLPESWADSALCMLAHSF